MKNLNFGAVENLIIEVADTHILPRFGRLSRQDISYKIGDDPVTIADKEAELALSAGLIDLLPGSKILGEEGFSSNHGLLGLFSDESPVWIIDPIDGTRNFVRASSDFGVIVALAKQNQTIAGWIYHPTSREMLSVEKGSGAYFKGTRLKVDRAFEEPQHMKGFLGDRLIADLKASKRSIRNAPYFEEMMAGAVEYSRLVLNLPHFGRQGPQYHFRASKQYSTPWDDAAGVLIHQEAGGYSAFWDGQAYQPSEMHRGFALTPDAETWFWLKEWCSTFTSLPKTQ